jgi:carbamoyl-phosphate synthase small subunit
LNLKILLEDGSEFKGKAFGAKKEYKMGELVFFTGMTGYQEVLSDPSYCDQMVCMTYPLIGNYGLNRDDFESLKPYLSALVIKEYCDRPSNWRSQFSLDQVLKEHDIPGITRVDTRAITRKVREHGSMKSILVYEDGDMDKAREMLKQDLPTDQVSRVSTKQVIHSPGVGKRIVVYDFGIKKGILKELSKRSCDVIVVPHDTTCEDLNRWKPDGVLLSNGPGDPRDLPQVIEEVKKIRQKYPSFGICLGHQLLSLSYGCQVEKLKFGHHGANHPVYDYNKEKAIITSQNHNYAVVEASIKAAGLKLTHTNLNDKSVAGFKDEKAPVFGVQHHPEASPGPQDSSYLFDEFLVSLGEDQRGVNHARS